MATWHQQRGLLICLSALGALGVAIPFAGCGGGDGSGTTVDLNPLEAGTGDDDVAVPSATCGNHVVERGEDCDDGNKVNGDACENDCTFTCTAGTVNGDSRCDDHEPCNGVEKCSATHTCTPGTGLADHAACGTAKICRNGVCSDSVCGDNVVTAPEECDDGNSVAGDGCETTCKFTCVVGDAARSCTSSNACVGNGTCSATHQCTAGTPATNGTTCPGAGTICNAGACVAARCGDGITTAPEACDDGNQTNGDGCETTCKLTCANPATDCPAATACNAVTCSATHTCQSGADAAQNGHSCGNAGSSLICKNGACVSPSAVCGNGTIEAGEDCDFGNGANTAGSGCEANCKFTCTVAPNSCDDGNPCDGAETCGPVTVNGHAGQICATGAPLGNGATCGTGNICLGGTCKQSLCGDGYIDASHGEQCEPPSAGSCDASCHLAVCGNGTREQGEQCDDGNTTNLDGCDGTCAFEQSQRVNQLKMQFATDTYCTKNALGGAIGAAAQSQIQGPLDTGVTDGSISVLFKFTGTDLSGTNGAVTLGSVAGSAADVDAGAYNGNNDLDWWYPSDISTLDGQRNPVDTFTGTYTSKTLNAGPGRFAISLSLSGSPAKLHLWSAFLRTAIGATSTPLVSTGIEPGHLASEHLDPALQSFAASGVGSGGAAAGQLCGNVTVGSLATVAVPTALRTGASNCVEAYAATDTLLDVYIGGCKVLGGIITVISKTQPDQIDTAAPQSGAGGPYKLSASVGHTVDTCKDKNGATVPIAICYQAMAYSSSFKFTTDRVILK